MAGLHAPHTCCHQPNMPPVHRMAAVRSTLQLMHATPAFSHEHPCIAPAFLPQKSNVHQCTAPLDNSFTGCSCPAPLLHLQCMAPSAHLRCPAPSVPSTFSAQHAAPAVHQVHRLVHLQCPVPSSRLDASLDALEQFPLPLVLQALLLDHVQQGAAHSVLSIALPHQLLNQAALTASLLHRDEQVHLRPARTAA